MKVGIIGHGRMGKLYHEVVNEFLLLQWEDDTENILELKSMREK